MGLIEWIGAILGGIAVNLIASELFAWGPCLSKWLTRWAIWRLPVEMQERLREEWSAHLDALHPLTRTLAAIGFLLAAYRVRVRFERHAKGAFTLQEWLALKPIVAVVMTEEGAMSMGHKMLEALDLMKNGAPGEVDLGPIDAVLRQNLMAKAKGASRRVRKRILRLRDKQPQPKSAYCTAVSRTISGDVAVESADGVLLFRVRRTIVR